MRDDQQCKLCEFYCEDAVDDNNLGECRRRSPSPFLSGRDGNTYQESYAAFWPVVSEEDQCGEFRRDYPAMQGIEAK